MRSGGIDGSSMPRSGRVALVQHPPVWHCWMSSTGEAMTTAGLDTQPSASTYNLEIPGFVSARRAVDPAVLPLPVLFDLDRLLEWFSGSGRVVPDSFAEARRVAKLLRQFKVPAYLVRQGDEKTLTDIFDRMNN